MKVLVVINPKSGSQTEANIERLISEEARKSAFEFKIHKIRQALEKVEISRLIKEYKPNIVAAAGGDGRVNLLAQLLANTNIAMLIIPTGSANGMAKELGIGGRLENIIPLLTKGSVRDIDLLKINGITCIVSVV